MSNKRMYSRTVELQTLDLAKCGQENNRVIECDTGIMCGLLHKWNVRVK